MTYRIKRRVFFLKKANALLLAAWAGYGTIAKSDVPKPVKSVAPIPKAPKGSRSGKSIEMIGGAAYMDGILAPTGNLGLFVGPDIVLEAGLFLGMLQQEQKYLELFAQGKLFVFNSLFLAAGGGLGQTEVIHKEEGEPGARDWKESALKLRLYGGIGAQYNISFITIGLQTSAGYGLVMGEVNTDIEENPETGEPVVDREITIRSGLSTNVYGFAGFVF